jgi:hypothetical protein
VKYVVLIYSNAESRKIWESFPAEARAAGLAEYQAINDELTGSGEMIIAQALADPASAKRVLVRDGRTMATDGPFAEVKEQLAGFYLLDLASAERAVEIAGRFPEAGLGLIEVRPVRELDDLAKWL